MNIRRGTVTYSKAEKWVIERSTGVRPEVSKLTHICHSGDYNRHIKLDTSLKTLLGIIHSSLLIFTV